MAQEPFQGIPADLATGAVISSARLNLYGAFLKLIVRDGTAGTVGQTSALLFDADDGTWRVVGQVRNDAGDVVIDGTNDRGLGARLPPVRFTASGDFVKANYPWARWARLRLQSAGGAGGGSQTAGALGASEAAGGGAGCFAERLFELSDLPASVPVDLGAAGLGTSGDSGGDADESSFGDYIVLRGGRGGGTMPATQASDQSIGGVGGIRTSGGADVVIPGERGRHGQVVSDGDGGVSQSFGNDGGRAHLGPGGHRPFLFTTSGAAPIGGYGGGGSGAASANNPGRAGGDGGAAVAFFDLF